MRDNLLCAITIVSCRLDREHWFTGGAMLHQPRNQSRCLARKHRSADQFNSSHLPGGCVFFFHDLRMLPALPINGKWSRNQTAGHWPITRLADTICLATQRGLIKRPPTTAHHESAPSATSKSRQRTSIRTIGRAVRRGQNPWINAAITGRHATDRSIHEHHRHAWRRLR